MGIEINTESCTLSIPESKINALRDEMCKWQGRKSASKRAIQRLLGRMNWAAKCVRAARPCMRRLIALTKGHRRRSERVRLTAAVKEDLKWWIDFTEQFNGVSYWYPNQTQPDHVAVTDASPSGGAAAYAGDFLYTLWECDVPSVRYENIHVKEMYAILLAIRHWGHCWRNSLVHMYTDSNVALYTIWKGAIDSAVGMHIIREIHLLLAVHNIYLELKRIDTKANWFADALSRLDNIKFARKAFAMLFDPALHKCRVVCDPLRHMTFDSWLCLLQAWDTKKL